MPAQPAPLAATRPRLDSLDLLRGAVMILMALDHARDFFTSPRPDPVDLAHTTPILFATRWVTHYCAPVFSFLAGTGAFLSRKPKRELSWFLLTRGLWLIVLEFTVVHVGFVGFHNGWALVTMWALGTSMMALAGLVFLPTWAVASIAGLIIVGHNSLDGFHGGGLAWQMLHSGGPVGRHWFVGYPILPWIGVMAAGYAFGEVMVLPADKRRRTLWVLGLSMIAAFLLLRGTNFYGDPKPWASGSLMSFLNTEKYPPSLLYVLMTLGPAIVALALLDGVKVSRTHFVVIFGRVPLFFYVLHLFVLHIPSWIYFWRQYGVEMLSWGFGQAPDDFGVPLWGAYLAWALGVVLLYPLCRWYAGLKARSHNPWLSYL